MLKAFIDKLNDVIAGVMLVVLFLIACGVVVTDQVMGRLNSWANKNP